MEAPQKAADFNPEALAQRFTFLEAAILEKDVIISEKTSLIPEKTSIISEQTSIISEKTFLVSEKTDAISKLSAELQAERFKYAQLQRMIFGSERERFVSSCLPVQMVFEFEPKTIEVEQTVAEERESIRIAYERKKSKKAHQGCLALPDHLPLVETILEPEEDTTGMVCIGMEVTEELDYTAAKLNINRIIRPKYITKEKEEGCQKQVIAPLNRPIHKCIASAALLSMIFTITGTSTEILLLSMVLKMLNFRSF